MRDVLKLKKKYQSSRIDLFKKLASTNDGFYFNKNHTDLVDTVVKEIVKGIYNIYPIEDFSLIAVGGYGRHDLSPKSDVDLLFIYKKSNKNIRDFITQLNNTLWDIGLEVGISFLTIKQALIDSKKDIKTITKFVETRFIIGDEIQYGEFVRSIKILIGKQNPLKLSELKLIELVERHDYRIGIKSNLEPNIKEGIGGLRDIHTILWVSIFMFNIYKLEDLTSINIYTKEEIKELKNAWKFLLTIRAFIHLFNESKGDVLSIENQLKISKKLSYKDKKKEKGVEIFMKDLFVNVAKINSLLRTFYSKLPEDLIIKTIYKRKPTKTKSLEKEFIIEKGFLNLKNNTAKNLQLKWANVFEKSLEHNLLIHPRFLKTVEEKRKVLKKTTDKQHLQSFLNIVVSKKNPIQALHDFNDTQLFSEIFPEFGRVWGQVQFDIYHHYTTDEHLLLTLHNLNELRQKSFYNEIYSRLSSREALHIALLFHDIGKKGPKNHSVYGTELTKKVLKRLPVSEEVKELTLWLVENHLLMSLTAQKQDIYTSEVIEDFARKVQNMTRLNHLYLLTVADVIATNPKLWNDWKAHLACDQFHTKSGTLGNGRDICYSSTHRRN
mgnify:CR=1 FL=1